MHGGDIFTDSVGSWNSLTEYARTICRRFAPTCTFGRTEGSNKREDGACCSPVVPVGHFVLLKANRLFERTDNQKVQGKTTVLQNAVISDAQNASRAKGGASTGLSKLLEK